MDLIGTRIGHIEIEALLGAGGMGEVYQGHDQVLDRHVAVKAIRPEHRMRTEARARFLREARMLSRLDHPNICRVLDYVEGDQQDHLILELVEGQTLRAALGRGISHDDGLRIAEQIAAALAAAHAQGIVHRDLKPANVMVSEAGEVKVLDFGLARTVDSSPSPTQPDETPFRKPADPLDAQRTQVVGDESDSLGRTSPGAVVGTLRYMSPEQAEGKPVTAAGDLWALGIVLQEIMTGRPAYPVDLTPTELRARVCLGRTEPMDDAPAGIARTVAALTDPDPEHRPSAEEVVTALRRARDEPKRRRRRLIRWAAATVFAVTLAAAVLVTQRLTREPAWLDPSEPASVALLPFVNDTGDPALDWVRLGLMEMVVGNLRAGGGIDVVPPADVGHAVEELDLSASRSLTGGQVAALRRALGAQIVVAVTVGGDQELLSIDYTAFTLSGRARRRTIDGPELIELAGVLSTLLGRRLNPGAALPDLRDTYSDDPMANREFAAGLQYATTEGPRRARLYFSVSCDRDPGFSRARLHLAACDRKLGDLEVAREAAGGVLEEARLRGDALLEAEALTEIGVILQAQGETTASAHHLASAVTILRDADSRADLAAALRLVGENHFVRSEWDAAEDLHSQALALWRDLGNRSGEGRSLNSLGMVQWRRGDWEAAEALFSEALAAAEEARDRSLQLACLNNLGGVALSHGDLEGGKTSFARALPLAQATGERLSEASLLNNLGVIAYYSGDPDSAEELWEQTLEVRRQVGHRTGEAEVLNNLASLAAQQERYALARERGRLARAIQRELGNRRDEALCVLNLGEFAFFEGQLDEATRLFAEAKAVGADIGEQQLATDAGIWQAKAALRQGRIGLARDLHRDARAWRPDYPPLRRLEALIAYQAGDLDRAVELLTALRRDLGDTTDPELDDLLQLFERARAEGRILPLP